MGEQTGTVLLRRLRQRGVPGYPGEGINGLLAV